MVWVPRLRGKNDSASPLSFFPSSYTNFFFFIEPCPSYKQFNRISEHDADQLRIDSRIEIIPFGSSTKAKMIPAPRQLLLPCFFKFSITTASLIKANAFHFESEKPPENTIKSFLLPRAPTFPEPTTTSAAQILQQNSACLVVGEALAICGSLSPGFTTLQPTAQAHCLCYSSTAWMPGIFDNAVKTCADYASTAVPSAYQPLSSLEAFCQSLGDVDSPVPTFALTTVYRPQASSLSTLSGQPCNSVNAMFNSCSSLAAGFSTLLLSDQARCLCYVSSTIWMPTDFDNAVATCSVYAQTVDTGVYSAMSALGTFCASVGNILATMPSAYYSTPTTLSAVASATPTAGPSLTQIPGSSSREPTSTSIVTDITITVGPGATITGTSSANERTGLEKMSKGALIGFTFVLSLLLLFL